MSDLFISQGNLVEERVLQKFLGKFQKKPEKQLPTSLKELERIKTFLPRFTKHQFSLLVIRKE